MDVTLALIADAANVTDTGKLNILGAFDTINADAFPYVHPLLVLVLRFSAGPGEYGKEKEIEIPFLDADGHRLGAATGKFQVPIPPSGRMASFQVILHLANLRLEKPGDYAFHVLVQGETKTIIYLHANEIAGGAKS